MQEISIHKGLNHQNINMLIDYGTEGVIVKPSGRIINNLVFIIMEYVPGGTFYDMCEKFQGMGETKARFFMHQLVDAIGYLHSNEIAHRDLKLENILVNENLDLKIADFGFATDKRVQKLYSNLGSPTYQAPEIGEGRPYDGRQADVFALGVTLFIMIQGRFPFSEARKDEFYYGMIAKNKIDKYWRNT